MTTFTEITHDSLNSAVAGALSQKIADIYGKRTPGHCMRVADLDDGVMKALCAEIRKHYPAGNIFILTDDTTSSVSFEITSTKLVELRNPQEDGSLRPALLVFIPTSLRTSAEDSFGIATFEELNFTDIYDELLQSSLTRVPATLLSAVHDIFTVLSEHNWPFADAVAKTRYLLTALENGIDGETLGAALYELALIPDFKLFAEPSLILGKIRRNVELVEGLMSSHKSVRGRIVDLGLSDKSLANTLFSFFENHEVHAPEVWTRPIALNSSWWPLSFDKWRFIEELSLDKIGLEVTETDLPLVEDDKGDAVLAGLIGQQILIPNERRKLNVVFEVNPHPQKVNGLDHFSVQIISQVNGPVGKSKKVKVWKPKRIHCTASLTKLNKIEFEEGWHYIRVLPWTAAGDPVPMIDDGDVSLDTPKDYESEPFYVLPNGVLEEEPVQRAIPFEKSLEHAQFRLQLTALGDDRDPQEVAIGTIAWAEGRKSRKTAKQEILLVKFGRDGGVQVAASRVLKRIEQRILAEPRHPSGWRMQINLDTPEAPSEIGLRLPSSAQMLPFLEARENLFNAIRQDSLELIVQGFSFRQHEDLCIAYAESYFELLSDIEQTAQKATGKEQQKILQEFRNVLAVDSVHVVLVDFRGKHRECALIAPTHPLRILWLLGWVKLGTQWIYDLTDSKDYIQSVRNTLLDGLQTNNFPVGIPMEDGRIFTPVDNLTPYWGVYAPTKEGNTRGLMAELCAALGVAEPAISAGNISGSILADKIERYLSQHPYVRELSINVFNPGSGSIIRDALLALQQKHEYAALRYDIRLFTSDPEAPLLGESLDSLVKAGSSVKHEVADAFAVSSGNHLFSKMNLARHGIEGFRVEAENYPAHISVLLDVFPAEELSVTERIVGNTPFYGLIQDYRRLFIDDDQNGTFWQTSPVTGQPYASHSSNFDLLATLSGKIATATATVATSGANFNAVPMVTLGLTVNERELIYQVHQVSDWVFTVDRNMGIEFFDHGGQKNRPDYLIDFVPGTQSQTIHNLIISSRSTEELEAMLKPVLERHGLKAVPEQAVAILAALRSLSGQLALKLISAQTQQAEALGLALARLYLEYQGALINQIIVPLDAHTDLYRTSGKDDPVEDGISLQRTDLALFDLDQDARVITCNLVEVKCYSAVGDFAKFNQLKEKISQQINQSERILQRHFDPVLKSPDRPDRLLKSRELSVLLNFYLERSQRYEIFDSYAAKEAKVFLDSIEQDYTLQFRRCALVFDFEKNGTEAPDNEVGIEYHRIGKDLIQALLDGCIEKMTVEETTGDREPTTSLSEFVLSAVPKLESASFLAPHRERTCLLGSTTPPEGDEGSHEDAKLPEVEIAKTTTEEPQPESDCPDQKNTALEDEATMEEEGQSSDAFQEEDSTSEKEQPVYVPYDVMLGVNDKSPQYGLLGEISGRQVALDLNHTHTISLFGVQGGGKSYTLGSVIEMASMAIEHINVLPNPLASVIFHYSTTQDYAPEFTSMNRANSVEAEVKILRERFRGNPTALQDILILTPSDKVSERRKEYPDIEVQSIAFSATELKASHWKFLMGAIGNQSMYIRQINQIMRKLRNNISLQAIEEGIEDSSLSDHLKDTALTRLQFAGEYIDDKQELQSFIRPGRLIIVDLRDEFIEKDEALGLFLVMLQIFSEATNAGTPFNKLVVFDEAHKYIENDDLVAGLVEVVREMRHKGTSIMVASQDPPSVPISLIELSTQIIMHKFNSPAWLKHIQKANAALGELTSKKMSHLDTGEAYVWSSKSSDDSFTRGAVKIRCRPRVTQHGGSTKTAVGR